jgi:hypothetical protein
MKTKIANIETKSFKKGHFMYVQLRCTSPVPFYSNSIDEMA